MDQGKFITLEGIDGAGKTTQLTWITEILQARGINVVVTREPGGTPLGEKLRAILLDNGQNMHPETETLLMFAARREHLDKIILPALKRGDWIISDRFTDASFAYQGGGRGVELCKLEILEKWTQGMVQPDLTIYLDVPVEIGKQRIQYFKSADRFEKEQENFFYRVRAAYLERTEKFSNRMFLIDASDSLDKVKAAVKHTLQHLFSDE